MSRIQPPFCQKLNKFWHPNQGRKLKDAKGKRRPGRKKAGGGLSSLGTGSVQGPWQSLPHPTQGPKTKRKQASLLFFLEPPLLFPSQRLILFSGAGTQTQRQSLPALLCMNSERPGSKSALNPCPLLPFLPHSELPLSGHCPESPDSSPLLVLPYSLLKNAVSFPIPTNKKKKV